MPLRPTDIQRPGVASPGSARVTQSTIKSPKSIDNRGSALGDVADATRRLGAATENLAQGRRRGGDALARAVEQQSGVVGRTGEQRANIIERAAQQKSVASENFAKNLGDITDIFLKLHDQREEATGNVWESRYNLALTKRMESAYQENSNAPGTGEDYVNTSNETYEKAKSLAYEDVKAELGDAPDAVKSKVETTGYAMQTSALKRTIGDANNQKVHEMVAFSDQTVKEYITIVQSTGDEESGLLMGNRAIDDIVKVLPAEQIASKRRGLQVSVAEASIEYSIAKNDWKTVEAKKKALSGESTEVPGVAPGMGRPGVVRAISDAFTKVGRDPMVGIVISSAESQLDHRIKNDCKGCTAAGLAQFIKETGQRFGLPSDASTATKEEQSRAFAEYTDANARFVETHLGRGLTLGEYYMAHMNEGPKTARIIAADDSTSLGRFFSKKALKDNNMKGWTVGQYKAWAENKMQEHLNAVRTGKVYRNGKFNVSNSITPVEDINRIGRRIEQAKAKYVKVAVEEATVNMSSMPTDELELYANSFRPENITPEYEAPEGLTEVGNIDVDELEQVEMPNGSSGIVPSVAVNVNGQDVLVPTIDGEGKIISKDDAIKLYQKTGEHFGKFESSEDAQRYAEDLLAHQAGPKAEKYQMDIYEKVNAQSVTIQKLRIEDPALSVESVPSVVEARQVALKSKKPEDIQAAVIVSLLAQEAAGIPEHARAPITRLEAKTLAAPIIRAGRLTGRTNISKRNDFKTDKYPGISERDALEMVFETVMTQYGQDIGALVLPSVLEETTKDAQTGSLLASTFRKLRAGNATPSDFRKVEAMAEATDAKRAAEGLTPTNPVSETDLRQFSGSQKPAVPPPVKTPLPGRTAIQYLHDNPGSASTFDRIYNSPGLANKYLKGGN